MRPPVIIGKGGVAATSPRAPVHAATKPDSVNRYTCCVASYSAWNFVGRGPFSPGTFGSGRSNDAFFISIAFEIIGSMKMGVPL
jgi:hypothetical protein